MPKKILEDIKPLSRSPRKQATTEIPVHVVQALPREVPFEPVEPKRSSRYGLWYVAVLCVIGFLFSLSFLFERAAVAVTPKATPASFDSSDVFTAQKDSTADDTVVFSVMALSGDQSIKLPSTESKTESKSATGRVLLYNTYATGAYKLVKNTRLATPEGKIFRLDTAVTIPGYTKTGSQIIPGSVEVSVTAAEPGEGSNIETSDFTVPGLAGTAQATKIYGRTKTPLAGGISGTVYTIPQDVATAALGTLKDKLQKSLMEKAQAQIPDGYVLFPGATLFTTDDTVQVPYSTESQVPLALHGELTAYLLKEDTLVTAIAEKTISQYAGEPVTMPDIATYTLTPKNPLVPDTDQSFAFTLSGSAKIVWTVDPEAVKTLFAGRKKSEFNSLLGGVPAIDRATVVLKPFWKRTFPTDVSKITVTVEQP